MAERWNPWRDLRSRAHITFGLVDLPDECNGGVYVRRGDGRACILIDRRTTPTQRRCILAHELIHDEDPTAMRCDVMPDDWHCVVARAECRIDDEVARRLVPIDQLAEYADAVAMNGLVASAADVAAVFNVTEHIAERAFRQLLLRRVIA